MKMRNGFTLLEITVSVGIFAVIALSATAIWQNVIAAERLGIAAQNTQESLRYVFATISKEIRTAQSDNGSCTGQVADIYVIAADNSLRFVNQYGECVSYLLASNRFMISRVAPGTAAAYLPITPDEIIVSDLAFYIKTADQPAVSVTMKVYNNSLRQNDLYKSELKLQTTISSRNYQ